MLSCVPLILLFSKLLFPNTFGRSEPLTFMWGGVLLTRQFASYEFLRPFCLYAIPASLLLLVALSYFFQTTHYPIFAGPKLSLSVSKAALFMPSNTASSFQLR